MRESPSALRTWWRWQRSWEFRAWPSVGAGLLRCYRSARLPANLTQAQRDYFGAHTFQRVDQGRRYFHAQMVTVSAMILIVMGVAGSGKSTIGQLLADRLGWPFFDGDDFHPPANIEKMRRGQSVDG